MALKGTQQQKFIELLAELLLQGFSINEALVFMHKAAFFEKQFLKGFRQQLRKGKAIHEIFRNYHFKEEVVLQIRLAHQTGDLPQTLQHIGQQLNMLTEQQQRIRKALTYPGILVMVLVIILFAFRQIILPRLLSSGLTAQDDAAIIILNGLPQVFIGGLGLFIIGYLGIEAFFRYQLPIAKARFYGRIPLIKKYYQLYVTSFFALEWGKLFRNGLEMKQIIYCMKNHQEKNLMQDLARLLEKSMQQGADYLPVISQQSFFTSELSVILQRGSIKGNLGAELLIYSEWLWQKFFQDVEKALVWLQPLIYLGVAVLIIIFYAALLLPIYGNLGGGIG